MNTVEQIDKRVNVALNTLFKYPILKAVVQALLILYAARLAPTPPKVILDLFENTYFKVLVFALILWTAQVSPSTAMLIAIAFMITVNYSTTGRLWELMEDVEAPSVEESVAAVVALADSASKPVASDATQVEQTALIAVSPIVSDEGKKAVSDLAQQSVVSEAGDPQLVKNAVETAIKSMEVKGCYPMRNYDMSKVVGLSPRMSPHSDFSF